MNGCRQLPLTIATELPSSTLCLVNKIDCVTSTIAVSTPLPGANFVFVGNNGQRQFNVDLRHVGSIFCFFGFELQFLSCSQDTTCLVC